MKLVSLNVDSNGDSYFTEIESGDAQNRPRQMDVAYWDIWETQPGHFQDFQPMKEPCWMSVLNSSGKLEITSSVGDTRNFALGDSFLLQDLSGKGHALRTYGWGPCTVLRVFLKQSMSPTAT